jgi:hypothetical protein
MAVLVIYRDPSEHAREVETFLHDFKQRTSHDLTVVDPDSRRGSDLTKSYDIVEYPTVLALSEDGQVRNMWRGLPLPTIGEVSYYVQ